MEINFKDYMTGEEIKKIIVDEFKSLVKKDTERILSNVSYQLGDSFIKEFISENDLAFVKEKVTEILHDKQTISYRLFSERNAWDTNKLLKVSEIIEQTIMNNMDILKDKTIESMKNIDVDKLTEFLTENFDSVISAFILFNTNKKQ